MIKRVSINFDIFKTIFEKGAKIVSADGRRSVTVLEGADQGDRLVRAGQLPTQPSDVFFLDFGKPDASDDGKMPTEVNFVMVEEGDA